MTKEQLEVMINMFRGWGALPRDERRRLIAEMNKHLLSKAAIRGVDHPLPGDWSATKKEDDEE